MTTTSAFLASSMASLRNFFFFLPYLSKPFAVPTISKPEFGNKSIVLSNLVGLTIEEPAP